jgi:hypothetical protein
LRGVRRASVFVGCRCADADAGSCLRACGEHDEEEGIGKGSGGCWFRYVEINSIGLLLSSLGREVRGRKRGEKGMSFVVASAYTLEKETGCNPRILHVIVETRSDLPSGCGGRSGVLLKIC